MATTTYFYRGGAVDLDEIQRTADPGATSVALGEPVLVSVTADSANKEALDDAMAVQGFFEETTFTQPLFRRTLEGWVANGLAASLLNVPLVRWGTSVTASLVERPGWLLGLAVLLDINAAGAALTATVFVNGVTTGVSAVVAVGTRKAIATVPEGTVALAAGDLVDVRVSTPLGWLSVLAVASVEVEIEV